MMTLNFRFKIYIILIVAVLAIVGVKDVMADPVLVIEGSDAPLFKGIDFNDKGFDLNDYYKKVPVILNFFSVHCVSCLTAVNILEKYKNNNRITNEAIFIYVSLDDWKREKHVPKVWESVFKNNQMRLSDGDRKIGKLYEVDTLPATIIIDKNGKIIYRRDDYSQGFDIEIKSALDPLLKNK